MRGSGGEDSSWERLYYYYEMVGAKVTLQKNYGRGAGMEIIPKGVWPKTWKAVKRTDNLNTRRRTHDRCHEMGTEILAFILIDLHKVSKEQAKLYQFGCQEGVVINGVDSKDTQRIAKDVLKERPINQCTLVLLSTPIHKCCCGFSAYRGRHFCYSLLFMGCGTSQLISHPDVCDSYPIVIKRAKIRWMAAAHLRQLCCIVSEIENKLGFSTTTKTWGLGYIGHVPPNL